MGKEGETIMVANLNGRIGLLFLAFLLLVSISVGASFWTIEAQRQDGLVINLAGRQRMLVQQMAREALRIQQERGQAETSRAALGEAIRTFDQTLRALRYGGVAPDPPAGSVEIPVTYSPDIQAALYQVQDTWQTMRSHLELILVTAPGSPDFGAALQAVERLSPELLQQADQTVRLYESASSRKVTRLRWIQYGFAVGALVLLAVGVVVTHRSIVRPLLALGSSAERMGRGDLSTPVVTSGPYEITRLAHSFDAMRIQLKTSQMELITWAQTLEERVEQRTQELAALYEISREISSRLDIKHVLHSVTDKARALLSGDVAVLCLLEESPPTLVLAALSGPQDATCAAQAPVGCLLVTQVLAGSRALPCGISECLGACGILAPHFRASHLAAPLRAGDREIGALCVGGQQAGLFGGDAPDLLTKLANSAAIALENARLYQQAERVAMMEERQRIAAEIHDGLAQTLNYLPLKAELVAQNIEAGQNQEALEMLDRMAEAVVQASCEVRQAIANLQEGRLHQATLPERLAEMVKELSADDRPSIVFAPTQPVPWPLAARESDAVLGVVREAVQNACRHAQAEHITIQLEQHGTEIAICVEDDGRGFDPAAPPSGNTGHFGLSIMRARAARLGGRLAIHSTPGQGTQVVLSWPADDRRRRS